MKAYVLRPGGPGAGLKSGPVAPAPVAPGDPLAGRAQPVGLSKVHIPPPPFPQTAGGGGELILYRGTSLLKLPGEGVKGAEAPAGKRGQVKELGPNLPPGSKVTGLLRLRPRREQKVQIVTVRSISPHSRSN